MWFQTIAVLRELTYPHTDWIAQAQKFPPMNKLFLPFKVLGDGYYSEYFLPRGTIIVTVVHCSLRLNISQMKSKATLATIDKRSNDAFLGREVVHACDDAACLKS